MTKGKNPAAGKGKGRNLKLKKQTLKDLDAKGKSRAVKGGVAFITDSGCKPATGTCIGGSTCVCPIRIP